MARTNSIDTCPYCGRNKLSERPQCRYCAYRYDSCPNCGQRKMKKADLCQKCKALTFVGRPQCKACGKRVGVDQDYCVPCRKQVLGLVPKCVDCGCEIKRQYARNHFAKRCWPCEVERRRRDGAARQAARPACSVAGCDAPSYAKGKCHRHYARDNNQRMRQLHGSGNKGSYHRMLSLWPCQVCGYDRMSSAIHRPVPGKEGGKYVPGNMVAVCSRCHIEVERGLTPCPIPPTAEEIESYHRAHS